MAASPQSDRGRRGRAFTLLTPANHYASRLPSLPGATVFKLITPRLTPARFAEYLIEPSPTGLLGAVSPGFEHFFFGLAGAVTVRVGEASHSLQPGGYAYLPESVSLTVHADPGAAARLLWLKRRYEPWPGLAEPEAFAGRAAEVAATATLVPGLSRRELIDPLDPAFDFNMSLMRFQPGVALHQIEIHDEEHGLYMTSGDGDYQLDGGEYPVAADDFIYMAPYCPQGFRAGRDGAEYLLYKDVYRDGF